MLLTLNWKNFFRVGLWNRSPCIQYNVVVEMLPVAHLECILNANSVRTAQDNYPYQKCGRFETTMELLHMP